MRIFFKYLTIFVTVLLISCSKPSPDTLVVGTIAGPETDVIQTARKIAKERYGVVIKIVEFNDYNLPNEALQNGSLDVNIYQHLPYLEQALKTHKYDLEPIGKTFIYPVGVYSKKYKSINELPQKAIILLPNDPSNEIRALKLLEQAGLIKLKSNALGSLNDIENNPHNFIFKELDAAQLARSLNDVDAAVINTTFAIPAGLSPSRNAIYLENKDSPYANLIVIKKNNPKKQQLEALIKSLHSSEVQKSAHTMFGDGAIKAW